MEMNLGEYDPATKEAAADFEAQAVLDRIWARDHTVWHPEPAEISNRLGWLDIADRMASELPELRAFARAVSGSGIRSVVLLGMGGSSLAPEVFSRTFGAGAAYPALTILDSTDPGAIKAVERTLDIKAALFIVASKSGGTVETLSLFKYFYNRVLEALGPEAAGSRFIAITDPESRLAATAERLAFRRTFINDPNIGGRYSALSFFGLVPAALIGVDLERLLERAAAAAQRARAPGSTAETLGLTLGALAKAGRDKLTLVASPRIGSFPDWVEQLVAESTGKRGAGILPIASEPRGEAPRYGADRIFVGLGLPEDETVPAVIAEAQADGHPTISLQLDDLYDLGGQFFTWELATAIAGRVLGIQPFDQPNVESAKVLAREMVETYHDTGALPDGKSAAFTSEELAAFVRDCAPPAYIAIQAYAPPGEALDRSLTSLQAALRERTGSAVTVGYGPRFLHSTGQLHKGDAGNGRFIQITTGAAEDLPIPDEPGSPESAMRFNVLKLAQALGDYRALETADPPRQVIRFHVEAGDDPATAVLSTLKGMGE